MRLICIQKEICINVFHAQTDVIISMQLLTYSLIMYLQMLCH